MGAWRWSAARPLFGAVQPALLRNDMSGGIRSFLASAVPGMARGIPGGAVCCDAIGNAICNCELEPVHGLHVAIEKDTVAIIDQCEDGSDDKGNLR